MPVVVLAISIYQDRWKHTTVEVTTPSWQRIRDAILSLDQFHRPFITLQLTTSPERNYLTILGGNGVYTLASVNHHFSLKTYRDSSLGKQEVSVWTSDQGLRRKEHDICYDLDTVIRVAEYWTMHGQLDPSVNWADE